MTVTIKLRSPSDRDLSGFISIVTQAGYAVRFRQGGNTRLMCDITDDESIGREWAKEEQYYGDDE